MSVKASVVIPTYNRKAILEKTLRAITDQSVPADDYEVIVVDDGSTDGTGQMVQDLYPNGNVRYAYQKNSGRSRARNHGINLAQGEIVIFIDSDIVVTPGFIAAHLAGHAENPRAIVNGFVINTSNFDDPTSEPLKLTDHSRASFATGNSSVRKKFLLEAGLFDEEFNQYGWEDLELGHRLLALGLTKVKASEAVGYHFNPPVSLDYLPEILRKERERGKMALLFYTKNPTLRTRMTTLFAPPFFWLERVLNLGGWPDWKVTEEFMERLKQADKQKLFRFLAEFKKIHAYFEGMREGRRGSKQ